MSVNTKIPNPNTADRIIASAILCVSAPITSAGIVIAINPIAARTIAARNDCPSGNPLPNPCNKSPAIVDPCTTSAANITFASSTSVRGMGRVSQSCLVPGSAS